MEFGDGSAKIDHLDLEPHPVGQGFDAFSAARRDIIRQALSFAYERVIDC
jgi:hypothetical protein